MRCRVCNSDAIKPVQTVSDYPIIAGPVVPKGYGKVRQGDVSVGMCMDCGLCQLTEPVPGEVVYDDMYSSSNMAVSMGAEVDSKTERFLLAVRSRGLEKGAKVLEIGCYDGSLMSIMKERFGLDVYGCDPCGMVDVAIKRFGDRVRKDCFTSALYREGEFDAVVFRNVLEHVVDPVAFLDDVWRVVKDGGPVILEVPDGRLRLESGILGSIVPEHVSYFGERTLRALLQACIMQDIVISSYRGGMIAVGRRNPEPGGLPCTIPEDWSYTLFERAALGARHRGQRLEALSQSLSGVKNIWLFGANTCSLELLATGAVNPRHVVGVVDDDPLKWGRELVNYDLEVSTREDLPLEGEKAVVVCSYYSQDAISNYLRLVYPWEPPWKVVTVYPEVRVEERNV